jgi:hypothetical protein
VPAAAVDEADLVQGPPTRRDPVFAVSLGRRPVRGIGDMEDRRRDASLVGA